MPSSGNSPANFEILFSPANHAAAPPSFGIVEHISANVFPAFAAAVRFSAFIPLTESENALRPGPNVGNSPANFDMLLSPVNQAIIPFSFGIVSAISAKAFAALAAAVTFSVFIPLTESENALRPFPNTGNSEAN